MKKKRVLIIIPSFKHGGTNRSLFNLLSLVDSSCYHLDIFGMAPGGYYQQLLQDYNILETYKLVSSFISGRKERMGLYDKLMLVFLRGFAKILLALKIDLKKVCYQYVAKKRRFQGYDVVISFQEGEATLFGSLLEAPNKIAWIHCDYLEYLKYLNVKPERELYAQFESIVCVSLYTRKVFSTLIPELAQRTFAIHNTINIEKVIALSVSKRPSSFPTNIFNIVSIGRMDVYKRFSAIPKIASELRTKGLKFKWHIFGGINHVEEEQAFVRNLTNYDVSDCVSFHGEVDNPYPYLAHADLLVSTSISEAFPYVLMEAKALAIPMVVTNFGSASECVSNEREGLICSISDMTACIERMMTNEDFYRKVKVELERKASNNNDILSQFYKLVN